MTGSAAARPDPARTPRAALLLGLLLGLLLATLVAGCTSLPTSGPVQQVDQAPIDETGGVNIPSGPAPGASPALIVSDFLDAMEAYPVSTAVATRFLTDEAAQRWRPDRGTIVYDERTATQGPRGTVALEVTETVRLSARGTYRPVAGRPADRTLFSLTRVDGEWRITDPPDRLFVRSYFFERYYAPFDLYFLDPTREALVADPVVLPIGDQLSTRLVQGLLTGPTPWLGSQATTSLPRSAGLEVSVPLRDDGMAEVQLSDAVADLSDKQQQLLSAQLVWTLRQVSGVEALRITVDGAPLSVVGADDVQSIEEWAQYNPSGPLTRRVLYALDAGGALVEVGQDGPVPGLWGVKGRRLRDFSVDRYRQRVAGIGPSGRHLVQGPLEADEPGLISRRRVTDGRLSDLQWDRTGLLWVLDHSRGRTTWQVPAGGARRRVPTGPLTRAAATAMAVSADGARVAALVPEWRGPVWGGGQVDGPCVVIARVVRGPNGRSVPRLDSAYALRTPETDVSALRDIAWSSPSDVVVIAEVPPLPPQPLELAIDGSGVVGVESGEELLPTLGAVSVASAGVTEAPTVVGSRSGELSAISEDLQWSTVATRLWRPHYPS
ncbi:MAG TPA: GerMN domain-containing protein [Nocardioidaceae bacterium]|jgi:hypothetical protein|nr:GerMN domain-containing protein [Nocardioidaceae bacterium]